MFGLFIMKPEFLLNEIVRIEYEPQEPAEFEASLEDGSTQVFACLKDGRRIDITKPVCVSDEGESVFLKVPNPCNHDPIIAYVESAIGALVKKLLLNDNVLVPRYQVRTLPHKLPFSEELKSLPCCLIETLEGFKSFGTSGNDVNVGLSLEQEERLSPEFLEIRTWQKKMLFTEAFAAVLVVMYFISNNDLHQGNFGMATYGGSDILALLDFDMSPMQFLEANNCFGTYNRSYFNKENLHHDQEGGRHTPDNLDLSRFPELLNPDVSAENWITTWCHGFNKGLSASHQEAQFRAKVEDKFEVLANLPPIFFHETFKTVFTDEILASQPQLANIFSLLTEHFIHFSERFQKVLSAHHAHRKLLSPLLGSTRAGQAGCHDAQPRLSLSFLSARESQADIQRTGLTSNQSFDSSHDAQLKLLSPSLVSASASQADLQSPCLTSNLSFYSSSRLPLFPSTASSRPVVQSASSSDQCSPEMFEFPLPPAQSNQLTT
jgi:hypothetical protein